MEKTRFKKGQYFSFDAIVAALIFIIAISVLTSYWFGIKSVIDSQTDDMNLEAMRFSDLLMTTGYPLDWQASPTTANQIGLMQSQTANIFDQSKIVALRDYSNTNYPAVRSVTNFGKYEFFVNISDASGTYYYFGNDPAAGNPTNVVTVQRVGVLNDKFVNMRVFVWTNATVN